MGKKKIALFYDESTESGKQILEFLTPFDKRKSDIVGELILLWIAEHGTNVPVQWLNRKKGELGTVKPSFPNKSFETKQTAVVHEPSVITDALEKQTEEVSETVKEDKPPKIEHDVSLIKAGLASFM